METGKRHIAEGWVEKASTSLRAAQDYLKGKVYHSDAVQAAQACVELSVKAVMAFLEIDFQKTHGWDKEKLGKIAEQIQKRKLLERLTEHYIHFSLPRLLFLANFWDQFYLLAKYGMESSHLAAPQDLFTSDEAEIAVKHAEECYRAATRLQYLPQDQLAALVN